MKETVGVIKEIDRLGRIVIPKEMRDRLFLEKRVELVLTKEGILLRNSEYELVKVSDKAADSK
jgi:AbrB family looped-hinge helix DNA binding protein